MDYFSLNYYGFDYLAAICGIIGIFFLGEKKRAGFLFYMAATIAGLVFATLAKSPPVMLTNVLMFIMNVRGYLLWKKPV